MEEQIVQQAVDLTGFGKFNLKVTGICALIYFNCAICFTSVGFVVPKVTCEFQMNTIDKGRITTAPMLGMFVASAFWGYFGDMCGRRFTLLISTFLQLSVDVLASILPSYWALVFFKFLSGVGAAGQTALIFSYLGEFQPIKYRHILLSLMVLSWVLGIILLPLLAWIIFPMTFQFKTQVFSFSSWNLFLLLSATPAMIIVFWLTTLPETPKFLGQIGQRDDLLTVLTRMYVENTGRNVEDFKEKLLNCGIPLISSLVSQNEAIKTGEHTRMSMPWKQKVKEILVNSKVQINKLMYRPYLIRLCTCSSIMFCMTSSCLSLINWIPELFERFAVFEEKNPGDFASVCSVSQMLNDTKIENENPFGCGDEIHNSVYQRAALMGVACIPFGIILPLTVNRVGYRMYLTFSVTINCVVIIAFYFVKTSTQNLIIACIFEASSSLSLEVLFCIVVEIFPTSLRAMASGIVLLIGRFGSFFGTLIFSYLIDEYCKILIIIMASQLFFASIVSFAIPGRDKIMKMQDNNSETENNPRVSW